jgi:DNA-directed RNA polymerase specialized sigma24 family protein
MLSEADIEDLAAEFSTRCLTGENAYFLTYDSSREDAPVRLRTYLCRVLDNYLVTKYRHDRTKKRGGQQRFESLDTTNPAAHQERAFESSGGLPSFDSESYDRHWAQHILGIAFKALESGSSATQAALPALRPWILADPGETTLKELARSQGRTHAAVRAQLHRLRKEWRQAIRSAVGRTVSHPEDIDDELRHLAQVLSRHPVE